MSHFFSLGSPARARLFTKGAGHALSPTLSHVHVSVGVWGCFAVGLLSLLWVMVGFTLCCPLLLIICFSICLCGRKKSLTGEEKRR